MVAVCIFTPGIKKFKIFSDTPSMKPLGHISLIVIISTFLLTSLCFGVNFSMKVGGLSQSKDGIVFQTTHETLAKLISRSKELRLSCLHQTSPCVRPVDYSHLKAHVPIRMEACKSGSAFPDCDDVKLELSINTKDLLLTGFFK